jgi:MYXO-CTERM domain-containing protein
MTQRWYFLVATTLTFLACSPPDSAPAESQQDVAVWQPRRHHPQETLDTQSSALEQPALLATPGWSMAASMNLARFGHTLTLLSNGKVLAAGGQDGNGNVSANAEVYDPATGTWTSIAALTQARFNHTATPLPNGKVLVVGGYGDAAGFLTSAQLYDPATSSWSSTGSLAQGRVAHTATLLPNGKVLVVGGFDSGTSLTSAQVYDPATGTWSNTGALTTGRFFHTATLLPNGKVLVVGGLHTSLGYVPTAELYDPATGSWSNTGSLPEGRYQHVAMLLPTGKVLIAAGRNPTGPLASAQLYDPATGSWSATGSLATARDFPSGTLLTHGKVLLVGGNTDSGPISSAEVYDPGTGTWAAAGSLTVPRFAPTTVLLPTGKALVTGGNNPANLASTELYDPGTGAWASTGSLSQGRTGFTLTRLPDGKVLAAGGYNNNTQGFLSGAQVYDPASGTWNTTGSLNLARAGHSATLLRNGTVLVAGGFNINGYLTSAELYDPATGTWSTTGSLALARDVHTATPLTNGKVLVTGGDANGGPLAVSELYDPATGTWSTTGPLAVRRQGHVAATLADGKVLIIGGYNNDATLGSVEVYDPATGTWSNTGSLNLVREEPSATLLPNGKVLVAGGFNASGYLTSAELYDPATGTWTATGSLTEGRDSHTANLLPSGKVLIAGGFKNGAVASAEVYDPASGTWSTTAPLAQARSRAQATLLLDGRVLIAGGQAINPLISAELYEDTGSSATWRPAITSISPSSTLGPESAFTVNGLRFRGISEASSGISQTAPTDLPLLTLMDPEGSVVRRVPFQSFSSTQVSATLPAVPVGRYLLFVTVNALSTGGLIQIGDITPPETVINSAPPSVTTQTGATFTFSSEAGATFECSLDSAAFSACSSPISYANLSTGQHTFQVRARDTAGNVDATPASFSWIIDQTEPNTTLTSTPANPSNQATATFAFSSNEAGATFECSLDTAPFSTCSSPISYANLSTGQHAFQVRARDAAGNVDATPASFTWTIDLTAPETTLTSTPSNPTTQTSATFAFSSEAGATFECSLDSAAFSACSSPISYANLSTGQHTFQVRARDMAGNVDATPASFSWTINMVIPPETTLNSTPANPTHQSAATFTFSSNVAGATFECSLDSAAFSACTSPISYSNLSAGQHTFQVRARDADGNVDATPASFSWTVDLTAPETTLTSTPANPTTQTGATFTFNSEAGATFECSLDGAAFSACSSPISYANLSTGQHTFQVRARDMAGNVDATPASFSWTINSPPVVETTLTSAPPAVTRQRSATFTFTSNVAGASFECSLDNAAFTPCSSPATVNDLLDGSHTFRVRARDAAGNVDSSPASHTWTVDLTPPETLINSAPPESTPQTSATFTFISEPGATFECSLDGAAYSACTSPMTYSNLSIGQHVFIVRAIDAVGNDDLSPAGHGWIITGPSQVVETTLTSAPPAVTRQRSATFTFTSNVAGASFECSLDNAAFTPCSSPATVNNLFEGSHTFRVRARDAAGNVDSSPASHTWTVDLTPPETLITSAPPESTPQTSATFTFSSEPGATFECSLDGAAYSACTSPRTYSNLSIGQHAFIVRAIDAVGNDDLSPAGHGWIITGPSQVVETTLTSAPPAVTGQRSATFTFTSNVAGASFECSLDNAAFTPCSSPATVNDLLDGSHTFRVRARDAAGNVDSSPASHTWTVDLTPPETLITSAPPESTPQTSATFTFISEPGATFECSLDGAAYSACTSPMTYSNLFASQHVFIVRAIDAVGNVDLSPAGHGWVVTSQPQTVDTTLTSAPTNPSNQTSATFVFSSNVAGATFECSLDGAAFSACTSPATYPNLSEGSHTFQVRARDAAGNVDATPASHTWTIDVAEEPTPTQPGGGCGCAAGPGDASWLLAGMAVLAGLATRRRQVRL